ncbi:MAG: DUF1841 family protein [Gammaproteobacteria bacterium]|nr:MAG: DUF1841 family protein [Gammaproteobacteria bacterium]
MFHDQQREQLRAMYFTAWDKARRGAPLEPLERQLAELIERHPEYHGLLARPEASLEREFTPEGGQSNPFLHLGLHMALLEQVTTDRPPGIRALWQQLCARHGDPHAAEHAMMEVLAETLWQAQRDQCAPDERAYLAALRRLTGESTPGADL